MLALSLRGAERRSNLDPGAHCPTRLLRGVYPRAAQSADPWARNDSHSIGFDQPDLVLLEPPVAALDMWMPTDQVRGLKAHGSSPRAEGPPAMTFLSVLTARIWDNILT